MTKECTLKEAYILKCLDEFQLDWRRGRDVTYETKMKIQKRIMDKYSDFFDTHECISVRSIEKTLKRIREKFKISADSAVKLSLPQDILPAHTGGLNSSGGTGGILDSLKIGFTSTKEGKGSGASPTLEEETITEKEPECGISSKSFEKLESEIGSELDLGSSQENIVESDLLCSYDPVPLSEKLAMCPCGCGYGYHPFHNTWYSPSDIGKGVIKR